MFARTHLNVTFTLYVRGMTISCELIAVKVLHSSLLNTTVVRQCQRLVHPSKTILELVLWNGLQSCLCITPDAINVIKMPSFQYFLYLREQKKCHWG